MTTFVLILIVFASLTFLFGMIGLALWGMGFIKGTMPLTKANTVGLRL
jgi:hypothetical protein